MNKSTLSNIVIFAVGAAIGSAVTWKLLKTKYEQIAQEYYYAGGNAISRMFFKDNDLPRLGRPAKRKAAYEREQKS